MRWSDPDRPAVSPYWNDGRDRHERRESCAVGTGALLAHVKDASSLHRGDSSPGGGDGRLDLSPMRLDRYGPGTSVDQGPIGTRDGGD